MIEDELCKAFDSQWNWIELKWIPGKGRGLVATQSLAAGTVILSENVLINELKVECMEWARAILARHRRVGRLLLLDFLHVTESFEEAFQNEPSLDVGEDAEFVDERGHETRVRFDQLRRAAAAIRSNTIETGGWFYLPIVGCMFNHACQPNAEMTCSIETHRAHVHLTRAVSQGEEVFVSYIDPGLPLNARRSQLDLIWNFECRCSLCVAESSAQGSS